MNFPKPQLLPCESHTLFPKYLMPCFLEKKKKEKRKALGVTKILTSPTFSGFEVN